MNTPTVRPVLGAESHAQGGGRARYVTLTRRSLGAGLVAAVLMAVFYIVVVRGASGSWIHLRDQIRQDWAYLTVILSGFGAQVALIAELRHQHRLNATSAAAGGTGAGASAVGMVACCAHHIADLLPFLGATGVAAFVTDYRLPIMLAGIAVNATGVFLAARRLHHVQTHGVLVKPSEREETP